MSSSAFFLPTLNCFQVPKGVIGLVTSRADIASLLKLGNSSEGVGCCKYCYASTYFMCSYWWFSPSLISFLFLSDQFIDLVIPRGSGEMVKYIKVSIIQQYMILFEFIEFLNEISSSHHVIPDFTRCAPFSPLWWYFENAHSPSISALKFIDLPLSSSVHNLLPSQENTRIPVMGHAEGVCHVYVDGGNVLALCCNEWRALKTDC